MAEANSPCRGCPGNQSDGDADGCCDGVDNCPDIPNHDQSDIDNDGIGDACDPDIDGDSNGIDYVCRKIPTDGGSGSGGASGSSTSTSSTGGSGGASGSSSTTTTGSSSSSSTTTDPTVPVLVGPADWRCTTAGYERVTLDLCPTVWDPGDGDLDGDKIGDACDLDQDGDDIDDWTCGADAGLTPQRAGRGTWSCQPDGGISYFPSALDNCPRVYNPADGGVQVDSRHIGKGDACNPDIDGDGVTDYRCTVGSPVVIGWDGGRSCDGGSVVQNDNCLYVQNPNQLDFAGSPLGDACNNDIDGDGCPDRLCTGGTFPDAGIDGGWYCNTGTLIKGDNCPTVKNSGQADDLDAGIGNACNNDIDQDGVLDHVCSKEPLIAAAVTIDGTWVCDGGLPAQMGDNCPNVPNPFQTDTTSSARGDACNPDMDGDGIPLFICEGTDAGTTQHVDGGWYCASGAFKKGDNCPSVKNADQADLDQDGTGDACDVDADGDGVKDWQCFTSGSATGTDPSPTGDSSAPWKCTTGTLRQTDNCLRVKNGDQEDYDFDGIGDACDPDYDGDGVQDWICPAADGGVPPAGVDQCDIDAGLAWGGNDTTVPAVYLDAGGSWWCLGTDGGPTGATSFDNCLTVANCSQTDTNRNGKGDACDVKDAAVDDTDASLADAGSDASADASTDAGADAGPVDAGDAGDSGAGGQGGGGGDAGGGGHGGSSGHGGAGGASTSSQTQSDLDAGDAGDSGNNTEPTLGGGCSCRVADDAGSSGAPLGLAIALMAMASRRRKKAQ